MAKIDHLDLATKHIYLAVGVREFHPVDNIYKEIRTLRHTHEEYRGTHTPVIASGNVAKGGGKFTPRLATFNCGWKIVPEDVSHVLYVAGEQITDEGEAGPACFDLAPLSSESKVIIQYEPPMAEIIETGISGLTEEESSRLMEVQAIKSRTDNLPSNPADGLLLEAHMTAKVNEVKTDLAPKALEATSQTIKGKTNNLPSDPAVQSLIEAKIETEIDEVKGANWTDETLKLIKKKIDELQLQPYPSRARMRL